MGNGLEIQVIELQKQNQILQIARQKAEETIHQTKQQLLQSEEAAKHLEEKNKYLQFLYDLNIPEYSVQ